MSVAENVQMALISHRGESLGLVRPARERYREDALRLLARGGHGRRRRPARFDACLRRRQTRGTRRRPGRPSDHLLMDEPTAGMAPREHARLMELTESLAEAEIGVLFTEHDMDVVFGHADRVLVLLRGEIIATGSPEEVRADPQVRQAYLGDEHALRSPP